MDNKGNLDKYIKIINDFITLIKYLNNIKKEKEIDVSEKSIISDVLKKIEDIVSKDFLVLFENQKNLTVNKIYNIFNYYLQLIFKDIKNEIRKFQAQNEDKEDKINKLYSYSYNILSYLWLYI